MYQSMKKHVLTLAITLVYAGVCLAQQEQLVWAKSVFGANAQCAPSQLISDNQGNIYLTGSFKGSVDFDPGIGDQTINSVNNSLDVFILKLNETGNLVWLETFGGLENDISNDITLDDAGNIYVTGIFRGEVTLPDQSTITSAGGDDIFIMKITDQGNFITAKQIGGDIQENISDILYYDGHIYATGAFNSTQLDFDPGAGQSILTNNNESDVFVLKLSANLDFEWVKKFDNNTQKIANGEGIEVDAEGNVYVVGYFSETVDFDPGAGTANLFGAGNFEGFIVKLDENGNYVWAQTIGGAGSDIAADLTLDENANIYITGEYTGTVDFDPGSNVHNLTTTGSAIAPNAFVMKLDKNGAFNWAVQLGGNGHDRGISIALDSDGNVFSSGNYTLKADLDPSADSLFFTTSNLADVYISKLSADGDFLWAGSIGGTNTDINTDITIDASGNILNYGYYKTEMDADPNSGNVMLQGGGLLDCYIIKLGQADASISEMQKSTENTIFPNPSSGIINVLSNEKMITDLRIYSNLGKLLEQYQGLETNSSLDLSHLKPGVYYIMYLNESGDIVKNKLIIQK